MPVDSTTSTTAAVRDVAIDAARVLAVGAVVVGHALVAAVSWGSGSFRADNVLAVVPATQPLTLVFQVMPLVFLCSGVATAASLEQRPDLGRWLGNRLERLLAPLLPYVASTAAASGVLGLAAVDGAALAGRALAMHVWFLAALLLVTVGAPLAVAADRRFGLRAAAALFAGAAAVDAGAQAGGLPSAARWANVVLVWGFAHQLGVAWRAGRFDRWSSRKAIACAAAGGLGIAALVAAAGYPLSMVGVPGGGRSNAGPPSLAMALLAVVQASALHLARHRLARWRRLAMVTPLAMGVYLWHFAAIVLAAVVVLPTGLVPSPRPGTSGWWATRPLWLAAVGLALVAVLGVARRVPGRPRPSTASLRASATATVLAAAGCLLLTVGGVFPRPALALPVALLWAARWLVTSPAGRGRVMRTAGPGR